MTKSGGETFAAIPSSISAGCGATDSLDYLLAMEKTTPEESPTKGGAWRIPIHFAAAVAALASPS